MGNFHTAPACGAGTESHPTKLGAETRRHQGTAGASKTFAGDLRFGARGYRCRICADAVANDELLQLLLIAL
jgi:hypothetical protein